MAKSSDIIRQCYVNLTVAVEKFQDNWMSNETWVRLIKLRYPDVINTIGFLRVTFNRAISTLASQCGTQNALGIFIHQFQTWGAVFNTTISLMTMYDSENRLREKTMTIRQTRQQGKYNGNEAGCLLRWIWEGDLCVCFLSRGGSIFITTISLMMMHDNKNGKLERTMTSRQQWQQGKYNGGKVGCLLQWIWEGDLCLFSIKWGVNI